ncbi:hypothetical protein cypCar_00012029, partial [Cyprinus carpio]
MAPISTDLVGWALTEQPEAAFLSIVVLFIVSIALLVLCASCKNQAEVLLCGIDSHKCPSNFETIETIGAPDRSLSMDWTDSKLNQYAMVQTRM